MKNHADIGRLNPVKVSQVEHIMADPVFDELRQAIMEDAPYPVDATNDSASRLRLPVRPNRRGPIALVAVAAVTALVLGLFTLGGGGTKAQTTVPGQLGRPLGGGSPESAVGLRTGTWRILDASLKGDWQQNTAGPPPGYLACPASSICYQMSGRFPSAMAGAPLLSESLYASDNAGTTWTAYAMPSDFTPTSPIACGGPTYCVTGGTINGLSVLISTRDGGHTFTIAPLPKNVGSFVTIGCTAINVCSGLAASRLYIAGNSDPTYLSTADGGSTFFDFPIIPGDSMESLSCSTRLDCTAVGTNDAIGVNEWTAGVVARTTDGGRTWVAGSLPAGFGISQNSELSCADALHCSVTGNISIHVANSPLCPSVPYPTGNTTTTSPSSAPNGALQAIEQTESRIASEANQQTAGSVSFSCSSTGATLIGDIASTVDGGHSWAPDALPDDVPQPMFSSISCPTARECWAAGSAAVPQQVGTSHNGGSSMLLGTTDGGSTWSSVRFSVPENAPNYDGQSYLSLGFITCPTAYACIANGSAAQGSPTAPIYTLTQQAPGY